VLSLLELVLTQAPDSFVACGWSR